MFTTFSSQKYSSPTMTFGCYLVVVQQNAVRYCIRYVTKIESSSSVLSMVQFFSRQLLKIQTEKRLRQQQQQQQHTRWKY